MLSVSIWWWTIGTHLLDECFSFIRSPISIILKSFDPTILLCGCHTRNVDESKRCTSRRMGRMLRRRCKRAHSKEHSYAQVAVLFIHFKLNWVLFKLKRVDHVYGLCQWWYMARRQTFDGNLSDVCQTKICLRVHLFLRHRCKNGMFVLVALRACKTLIKYSFQWLI